MEAHSGPTYRSALHPKTACRTVGPVSARRERGGWTAAEHRRPESVPMNTRLKDLDFNPDAVTIILVDDHPAIREALTAAIEAIPRLQVVGEVTTTVEVFEILREIVPDIAVVDISLRDAHGLDLIRRVRDAFPEVRMIVFSMHDEDVYAERAVRAGASGYVMKDESVSTVVKAIQAVAQGEVHLSRRIASRMLGKAIRDPGYRLGSEVDRLTARERTVFGLLGAGRSVSDIAAQLGLNRKTVETYRRRAKEKLSLETVSELLRYATHWVQDHDHTRTVNGVTGATQEAGGLNPPRSSEE